VVNKQGSGIAAKPYSRARASATTMTKSGHSEPVYYVFDNRKTVR
jgi:hypothetical protein